MNRCSAFARVKDFDKAVTDCDKALKLDPASFEGFYNLGNAYAALARDREAIEAYNRAIDLRTDRSDYFYNRGIVLKKLGEDEKALA